MVYVPNQVLTVLNEKMRRRQGEEILRDETRHFFIKKFHRRNRPPQTEEEKNTLLTMLQMWKQEKEAGKTDKDFIGFYEEKKINELLKE